MKTVHLVPLADEPAVHQPRARIFIIDDASKVVGFVLRRSLSSACYRTYQDPLVALADLWTFSAQGILPHLVIVDPEQFPLVPVLRTDGSGVIAAIRAIPGCEQIPLLILSHRVVKGGSAYLSKPFHPPSLVKKVRQALKMPEGHGQVYNKILV